MNELIEDYLDEHIKKNSLSLTPEQYRKAKAGVEFWLTTNLPDAVSDSVTAAIND